MATRNECPDCGVDVGQLHKNHCAVALCPFCRGQRSSCDCPTYGESEWTGDWPSDEEAIAHHLFVEGRGEELVRAGRIGGESQLLPSGIAEYDQLLASGFRPHRFLVQVILERYHGVTGADLEDLTALIMEEHSP